MDLVPDVWTKVKVEVEGVRARLYVDDQPQPVLLVNDVKTGPQGKGGVGLWVGAGTVAHFRALTVERRPSIAALEAGPESLDRYVGVYSTPDAPVKFTVTRRGSTLSIQLAGDSAMALEATGPDTFRIGPMVVGEFDAAKGTMTIKRPQGQRVFTKEP